MDRQISDIESQQYQLLLLRVVMFKVKYAVTQILFLILYHILNCKIKKEILYNLKCNNGRNKNRMNANDLRCFKSFGSSFYT